MNHLKRRSICKSCNACFVRDIETQVYCFGCLQDAHYNASVGAKEDKSRMKSCLICNVKFVPKSGSYTCSSSCKKELLKRNQHRHYEEKRYENDFEKEKNIWLNTKKRGNPNPLPFEEQTRRAEYKRVFGKGAYDHYTKGRRWDYI